MAARGAGDQIVKLKAPATKSILVIEDQPIARSTLRRQLEYYGFTVLEGSTAIEGLRLYSASQPLLPEYLYGLGLPRYVPSPAFAGLAAGAVAWAWLGRGREGLARFGVATVVAAPSAFAHGFLVALPAFLGLRTAWLWVALGITSVAPGVAWWLAILVAVAASSLPGLRREDGGSPWPAAPTR